MTAGPLSLFDIALKSIVLRGDAEHVPFHLKPEISRLFVKRPLFAKAGTNNLCVWCPLGCMTRNQRILYGHSQLVPKYALTNKQKNVHIARCDCDDIYCIVLRLRRTTRRARTSIQVLSEQLNQLRSTISLLKRFSLA